MKKLMTCIAAMLFVFLVSAQPVSNEKYVGFMKKNISMLDTTRSAEGLQTVANNFERVGSAEKGEWLPNYYAAYANVMKAFNVKDLKEIDPVCDKADALIAISESISPNNSEISTIKAMILTARLRVDGSRGMTMAPKATMILQQALQQQPSGNPRAIVQMAQMKYFTPPAFGGGKEAGIDILKKGIAAYDNFKPASELDPNWGRQYAQGLLQQWTGTDK